MTEVTCILSVRVNETSDWSCALHQCPCLLPFDLLNRSHSIYTEPVNRMPSALNNSFFNICPEAALLPFVHSMSPKASSSNQAENGHKYFFLLDFIFTFHAVAQYFPPYLQGVPNVKNSYLYSRLMFLQWNAEYTPLFAGGGREKEGGRRGDRHKGLSYFLCHLLSCTSAAIPLHHVKDCKQANNNSASETTVREKNTLSSPLCQQTSREKHLFLLSI